MVVLTAEACSTGKMVDTVEAARDICQPLLRAAVDADAAPPRIGLDLEGRDLGPSGQIAIVTVALSQTEVYLFDFADPALARRLLDEGLLRDVLKSPEIEKIMFDCRMDVGALVHQFDVHVNNVLDLQVPAVRKLVFTGSRYLLGMQKVFDKLRLMSDEDNAAKERGKKLFAPERGGAYEAWFKRPMPEGLVEYCVVDVKYFFAARETLVGSSQPRLEDCRKVSTERVRRVSESRVENFSAHRDF